MCTCGPEHLVPAYDSPAHRPIAVAAVEAMDLDGGVARRKQPGALSHHMDKSGPLGLPVSRRTRVCSRNISLCCGE